MFLGRRFGTVAVQPAGRRNQRAARRTDLVHLVHSLQLAHRVLQHLQIVSGPNRVHEDFRRGDQALDPVIFVLFNHVSVDHGEPVRCRGQRSEGPVFPYGNNFFKHIGK